MKDENKLEGFITISENAKCSYPDCEEKVVMSTIYKDKMKGINVEKIHYWCKKHFDMVNEGEDLR